MVEHTKWRSYFWLFRIRICQHMFSQGNNIYSRIIRIVAVQMALVTHHLDSFAVFQDVTVNTQRTSVCSATSTSINLMS